ncbi:DUF6472 family protein [Oribacterium sp. oral taxon 108]|uniref:DUF6472 family protein n=1 Tax=Oribacterium sp. oral taxon 108 TaxID=712414 RepID=UPI00020DD56C|nr:DUF6472 family protein [Oribacterium sp. oral taxon 108]EGL36651.1 hypothetical protein HMPREF9124_0153 [Oribacterium sp. oral taxon 108 str. F0425]
MNDFEDCNDCRNYAYDEDEDEAGCMANFDEDDLTRLQDTDSRAHCPYWCRSDSIKAKQSGNEYDTVKYQAIGHLSIEEIAKKAREKLAKRKEAKNG